jgi:MurNAc alpha-1-phosphate uridylyltransferase
MKKIKQAFIFAAGRGERMRPVTDLIPKPLVKINGKPMIDYIIEKLILFTDIEKIIVNGFYLANQIEDHLNTLQNSIDRPEIIFSHETTKLETGGGLLFAASRFDLDEPILLINGDILWQEHNNISDLKLIIENYNPEESDILLGLKRKEEVISSNHKIAKGDFNFNPITKELSKPQDQDLSHLYIGIQIINPTKILSQSPEVPFSMNYFYKKALTEDFTLSRIQGVEMNGRFFHIDSVAGIKIAEKMM